ncbi:ion transporter [Mariprofundus ferrooxydans]|uniref:ion transporter n=1 Tax=Mariprofundus ferrooxydans TaxID=314344 RepID=UPI00037CBC3A|nr:ion transporter [Mariprofundus ferrooxydans]
MAGEAVVTRDQQGKELVGLRLWLNVLLFEVERPLGRIFNVFMLLLITAAVFGSMVNTTELAAQAVWNDQIDQFEYWVLVAFAIEYLLRIYAARNRWHYMRSFNGLVDLITVLPLLLAESAFVVIRLLRLARVIRVAVSIPVVRSLFTSLRGSMRLLMGVLMTIALISVLVGNLIYILEPMTFTNAFEGAWWSLVTMSTVGYGDFVPHSAVGKTLAAGLIMSGICMFSMVTAVISVRVGRMINNVIQCEKCHHRIAEDFLYCPHCATAQPHMRVAADVDDDI